MHQGDIDYRFKQLESKVNDRLSGRTLQAASIGSGGLTVKDGGKITVDGGELVLLAEDGTTVAKLGMVSFGGESTAGWQFNYPTGGRAFIMGGSAASPAIVFYDLAGNYVMSTDAESGYGIARPYIPYRMVASSDSQVATTGPFWPSTNSSTFVELFHGFSPIQHPKISFAMGTAASGGATEWQLLIDSTTIATGTGNASGAYSIPGWGTTISPMSEHNIKIMVRNTTGSRSWAQVDECYGRES
ncbi:hypothetical protein ACFQS3_02690 [Glycomyces mayteni]|uniref:Uncharacterized protein n=1 Tax=Glycomyces mayteni TaxID=543887 RepID=A0ABW2D1C9_9ACTN|nr:hypothetical protein GCM10025732_48400 [Glycomyces mayteni]